MNSTLPQVSSSIHPLELHRRLQSGAAGELLDVRTPPEHAAGHVAGTVLAPLDDLDAAEYLSRREDPAAPLYVLCQAGGRARRAIEKFRAAGFDGCVLVEGGTDGWIAAGLPVERSASRVLPLQRQVHLVVGTFSALGAILALTVDPRFAAIPAFMGLGLVSHALTGACPLGMALAKAPWNRAARPTSCALPS